MRILHVFRTPVGGLFRHVRDLTRGQHALGHEVGILCDSTTGGGTALQLLQSVESNCSLGVKRTPISRFPGLGDLSGATATLRHARAIRPDVIHCHGAKGGLYGRLAARWLGIASIYTAHGGSLHYNWTSASGAAFLGAEWLLARIGSGLHFVCRFERDAFDAKIGIGRKPHAVIYNGLWPKEFTDNRLDADAADIVFIGDMRFLKGVDVLLDALALCNKERATTAVLVGDGPDLENFKIQMNALGLARLVKFPGRMAAAEALPRGRLLVMPSRAESFPYVALEAGAAGKPLIASNAGGIPEILDKAALVPPGDAPALAERIMTLLGNPTLMAKEASTARDNIRNNFQAAVMVDGIIEFYRKILDA